MIFVANHHFEAHPFLLNSTCHITNLTSFIKACFNTDTNHDHVWSNYLCFDKKTKYKRIWSETYLVGNTFFPFISCLILKNILLRELERILFLWKTRTQDSSYLCEPTHQLCQNLQLGAKGIILEKDCVATPLWPSVVWGWSPTLPKLGTWSPLGLPNV